MQWHRLLFTLAPESAHRVAIQALKLLQSLFPKKLPRPNGPVIQIPTIPDLRFRNRVGLAAGFDKNAEVFPALMQLGFGFVEVGTVTPLPQPGNPKPRIFRLKDESALVNRLGFNNVGLKAFQKNIRRLRPQVQGVPLFANIGKGVNTPIEKALEDYETSAKALNDWVDGLVINISSPNTERLRSLQSDAFLDDLARKLATLPTKRPIWIKLAPDLTHTDLETLLKQVSTTAQFTGVVLSNTSIVLAKARGFEQGGYSGPELFEKTLETVATARRILGPTKTIVGVGGVNTGKQAQQLQEAGADLIEIYTAFIYGGPTGLNEILTNRSACKPGSTTSPMSLG